MAILKDSRGLGCIVMFVAGATLTAGSTLKFELEFTDSGSTEQGNCEGQRMAVIPNFGYF